MTRAVAGTGLCEPPTTAALAAVAPFELRRLGLHERRGAALVRLCRSLELERLHDLPTDAVVRRIERERGLGPWSAGVVCLEGLGRFEHGLVGDLGLVKLVRALRGRQPSRRGRRPSCSSPTASGPASRASTSSRASPRPDPAAGCAPPRLPA